MNATIQNPVWPAMKVCPQSLMPSFRSVAEAKNWMNANAPRCSIKAVLLCSACGQFHVDADAPSPSGESSGTARSSKVIKEQFQKLKESL